MDGSCKLGVLAFGDSITNGGGDIQWGVALQSWALWVARGLGLPYTGQAVDGANVQDVVGSQIPAFTSRSAHPHARYELGCLYIGVNDVRGVGWDAAAFAPSYARALAFLHERCDRVLTVTAPLDLGRPRAGAKMLELNAVISRVAGATGTLLLDLAPFAGRNLVMADHVHPTALGQIAIAERALAVLARDGVEVAVRPSALITCESRWHTRLAADARYVYRRVRESVRTGLARVAATR